MVDTVRRLFDTYIGAILLYYLNVYELLSGHKTRTASSFTLPSRLWSGMLLVAVAAFEIASAIADVF